MSISSIHSISSAGHPASPQAAQADRGGLTLSRTSQTRALSDQQLLSQIPDSPHKQTVVHAFAQRAQRPEIRHQLNTDQDQTMAVLRQQGLPDELAERVLKMAGYGSIVMQLQALLDQATRRVDQQLSPDLPKSVRARQIANVMNDELSPQQTHLHPLAVHHSQSAQAVPLARFAFQENEAVLKQIVQGFVAGTPTLADAAPTPKWAGISQSAMLKLNFNDQIFFWNKFKTHRPDAYQRRSLEADGDAVLIQAALAYKNIQTAGEKPSFASTIQNILNNHSRDSRFFEALENDSVLAPIVHSLCDETIMSIEATLSRMRQETPTRAR